MNPTIRSIGIILALMCLSACEPIPFVLRANGDPAVITSEKGEELRGELICVQDGFFYLLTEKPRARFVRIRFSDVRRIAIEGYANRDWVVAVIAGQAVPTVLMTIAAISAGVDQPYIPFFLFAIPTLITYAAFEANTPKKPGCEEPNPEEAWLLSKYARYPHGLTGEQLHQLMQSRKQAEAERVY